jgi:low temperature requirement protein LtrA
VAPRFARARDNLRLRPERRERETVKPLELFFDLVFVLGFTQCTALMAAEGSWMGLLRGCLALALLWWAWTGYAWLTSVIEPEEGSVRLVFIAAMSGLAVAALAVPESYGDRGLTFAIAYGVVRLAHLALFLVAGRSDAQLRHSVIGFGTSGVVAVTLLVSASFLDAGPQTVLWAIAIVLDLSGALFGSGGWSLVPAHFAERHSLVIILALGEAIVALGVGTHVELTTPVTIAVVLGVVLAAALWWIYFDVVAIVTEQRLERASPGRERNALARDAYSYIHLLMVAGIVLSAFGVEHVLEHVDAPLDPPYTFALLGGVAVYLFAHVALRQRSAHTTNWRRLIVGLAVLAAVPLATEVDALPVLGAVNVVLWALIAYETHLYGESRYPLRHGARPEPGAPIGAERPRGESTEP